MVADNGLRPCGMHDRDRLFQAICLCPRCQPWAAGPDRIPELLDRIRTASVAAGRPADAVRAVYSVPVRLDPKARSTTGVIAGSAADITEQLHGFTELGFTGFDLMPSRDQMRALAEDVVPAVRQLRTPSHQAPPFSIAGRRSGG